MRLLVIIIILSVFSCSSSDKEQPVAGDGAMSEILDSPKAGEIHGTAIGDDREEVMRIMRPHIVTEMPDEITARIPLDIKNSTHYDIDYDFKDGKLYSIDLDIYPKDIRDCLLLFDKFKNYYNSIYGKGQETEGMRIWYTKAKNGSDVEIVMTDESKTHNKPYLAINFYQEEGIAD